MGLLWTCCGFVVDLLQICCGLVDVSYFQHVHMLRICCRRSICCRLVVDFLWICCGFVVDLLGLVDLLWICCEFVVDLLMSVTFSTFTCCGFVVGTFDLLPSCCSQNSNPTNPQQIEVIEFGPSTTDTSCVAVADRRNMAFRRRRRRVGRSTAQQSPRASSYHHSRRRERTPCKCR